MYKQIHKEEASQKQKIVKVARRVSIFAGITAILSVAALGLGIL